MEPTLTEGYERACQSSRLRPLPIRSFTRPDLPKEFSGLCAPPLAVHHFAEARPSHNTWSPGGLLDAAEKVARRTGRRRVLILAHKEPLNHSVHAQLGFPAHRIPSDRLIDLLLTGRQEKSTILRGAIAAIDAEVAYGLRSPFKST